MFRVAGVRMRAREVSCVFAAALVALVPSRSRRVGLIGLAGLVAAILALGGHTALGATPPGVAYGGQTSQHDQAFLLLSATRQSVKRIALDWDASCHGVEDFSVSATLGTFHIRPDGSFAKTQRTSEEGDKPSWSDHSLNAHSRARGGADLGVRRQPLGGRAGLRPKAEPGMRECVRSPCDHRRRRRQRR